VEDSNQRENVIGNLNGPWAIAFKAMLATYPIIVAGILGWGTWVTKEIIILGEFRNRGDRFTSTDASNMRREIDAQIASMPPKDWRDRYAAMDKQLQENNNLLIRVTTTLDMIILDLDILKKSTFKP